MGYNPKMGNELEILPIVETDLNRSQALFLKHYLNTFNARKSALAAGYTPEYGKELVLVLDHIIRDRLGEDYMTDAELDMRLIDIARGVSAEYLDDHGFVDFQKLKRDNKTHLIKSVQRGRDGINITFYDSQRALEVIGKSRGIVQGEVKRHLHGHLSKAESEKLDKAIDKIYGVEVVDAEFKEVD